MMFIKSSNVKSICEDLVELAESNLLLCVKLMNSVISKDSEGIPTYLHPLYEKVLNLEEEDRDLLEEKIAEEVKTRSSQVEDYR
jgi:hypothetical protein